MAKQLQAAVSCCVAIGFIVGLLGAGGAPAESESPPGPRWREHSHGVSFLIPGGAQTIDRPADDAMVRLVVPGTGAIDVFIKRSAVDMQLNAIVSEAIHQLGAVRPSATILDQPRLSAGKRSVAAVFFRIPDAKNGPWVMGQAFLPLDARSFVMFRLEANPQQYATAREIFEALIRSVEVEDPGVVNRRRTEALARGEGWRERITFEQMIAVLTPQRWYRIIDDRDDVGYMRIAERKTEQIGLEGIEIETQVRVFAAGTVYDATSTFFASEDGTQEVWSIRTTARPHPTAVGQPAAPPNQSGRGQGAVSWAETGVRSNDRITVNRETPSGVRDVHWRTPPTAYLNLVQSMLIDRLLPRDSPLPLGFYAYHPDAKKVTYQTAWVTPQPVGYAVNLRPDPQRKAHVSRYTPAGAQIDRVIPGGRVFVPTTRERLALTWNLGR